ncbi:hypothetical protein GCM10010193_29240 [Kitasatospora atroaurantiaca]|uniref:Uncharacterized protein n=1 Tax=Kitasatospora atroaurantiaca TaxID=285545 RepID=A0A561EIT8_9ACTN|nr:hypothetical protein [Kitasatospora atroaurantiaca]TWE15524.1 hypothetical protein FB465_0424 [Kitasatospora atroaurantiaca]
MGQGMSPVGRNTALLVLMPDAMVQDLWAPLDRRLAPVRLEVVATTARLLRPPVLAALYAHGTFKQPRSGRAPSSWLSHELATLDMAVPAVVRTAHDIDLAGLLDSWKGPSAYAARHPGDLRSLSPAAHRCFSVLHTPDDAAQTALDVSTLFGDATLRALADPGLPARCTLAELRRLRMPGALREASHPYDIVHRCATRAAALLAYDHLLRPGARWSAFAGRCATALGEPGGRWAATVGELSAELPAAPAPAEGRAAGEIRSRLDLYDALRQLLTPDGYGPDSCSEIERAFDANDLFLDGWERHTLRVALSFPLE